MDLALIIHKDLSVRETLASALAGAGLESLTAGRAEEGLVLLADARVPVAMVGTDLPGMGGLDFLKEARRICPDTEVIVLSGEPGLSGALACVQAGACDFLPGPVPDREQVVAAVGRAIEKGRVSRERKKEIESLTQKNEALLATNQLLAEQVKRDGLTGLYNHAYFQEVLAREASRAVRYNRSFCLLFLDLDHFKAYNAKQGRQAGDRALVKVGEIFRKSVRRSDYITRYGGEEFVILLPETAKEKGRTVAERILLAVEHHPFPGREAQPGGALTVSIGIAAFPEDGKQPEELVRKADEALRAAKSSGGNAFRSFG